MASKVTPATTAALSISSRFRGPSGSGNGGYACGRAAAYVGCPATVTLRRPPPLDTALAVEHAGDGLIRVHGNDTLIAEAHPAPDAPDAPDLEIPGQVSPEQAHAAAGRARYFQDPVFPDCFVCGPASPVTGCGSSPVRCPAGTCGRLRGIEATLRAAAPATATATAIQYAY